MAKIFTAPFAQSPKTFAAVGTTASANVNGTNPTNTVLLVTAGSEGALLTRLWAMPRSTVTATVLYLWLSKDAGTTKYLVDSELMAAQTVSTTGVIAETAFANYNESTPLRLEAADRLYIGIGVSPTDPIVFRGETTDF